MVTIAATTVTSWAQTPALPTTLSGDWYWVNASGSKRTVLELELSGIGLDGESVRAILTKYRSPLGNCIADNTPFTGTFKDGELVGKSAPVKSQYADGKPCGGIKITAKAEGEKSWRGTLTTGGQAYPITFAAK